MLLRIVGWLLCIESLFMILPLLVALIFSDGNSITFLISIGITALCGAAMTCIKPTSREMGKREAILLTSLIWIILSLFGMIPFLIGGTHDNITDAFFETMSGFTTTGASVLNTLTGVPESLLIWRCVVQWVGGLGIILFTLAVLPMLNYQGGMQLFNAEVTGITHDKLRPRVSLTARSLWVIYIVLTSVLIVLLSFSDMPFFDCVCYGLSTMSTGGFAVSDIPVAESNGLYIKIVLIIFMTIGGINFSLIYRMTRGELRNSFKNDALKWYLGMIFICYAFLCLNVWLRGLTHSLEDYTIDPLFQAVSILSSTGLTEPDFFDWGPVAMIVLIFMMFVGACAGSTSGGAKVDRIMILFKFVKNEFYKMMRPNAVTAVAVNGKGVPSPIVMKTLAFLFLYLIVIGVGGIFLVILGLPLKDSFFMCLSAISNTGLGTDITGINGNYAFVPDIAKWVLSIIMLVGRLELFTVLLLLTPSFWKK